LSDNDTKAIDPADLVRLDAEVWFSTYGTIKDKRGRMVRAPKPNVLQRRMFAHYRECQAKREPCKMVVLKPRQKGASTCSQALVYHHFCKFRDLNGSLMGDIQGTSDKVYEIFRRFAENDEFPWYGGQNTVDTSHADGIKMANGSFYGKETAGSKNAGRSGTIQVGNLTEVAFWNTAGHTDPALAYLQSLYDEEDVSLCVADSTPNGPSGWFYNTCSAAMNNENDWKFIFAAWFEFEDSRIEFRDTEHREEFEASLTDEEIREMEKYDCGLEQMLWRRRTLMDKCDGDTDKFRQEYPSDPVECFLKSSRPRFNADILHEMERECYLAERGDLNIQDNQRKVVFTPDTHGQHLVWEQPKPGCSYLVSVDTCTGEDQQVGGISADPDYHSAQVWRAGYIDHTGTWHKPKMVALHHSRLDIAYLTDEVASMSLWYGGCIVIPEVNNSGLALVKFLREMQVPMFQRKKFNDTSKMAEKFFGWQTDRQTRKTIIDELARAILERSIVIPCKGVLKELKTFVINQKGKPTAAPGHHDDHVLAAAIAVFNMDAAYEMGEPRRRRFNRNKMISNPTAMCPDGFSRRPLDMSRLRR
tara:strand:- start:5424 stop:7184 length:1761 start_codon:yes stop_codon:yes gene_type:complete